MDGENHGTPYFFKMDDFFGDTLIFWKHPPHLGGGNSNFSYVHLDDPPVENDPIIVLISFMFYLFSPRKLGK